MDTDIHGFSGNHSALTHKILGSAFDVLNELENGLLEKPYENALVAELISRGIQINQQKVFQVLYKNQVVGTYIPDLLANEAVIIDTKVIDRVTNRTCPDAQLLKNRKTGSRPNSKLQTSKARVRANHPRSIAHNQKNIRVHPRLSVVPKLPLAFASNSVHPWFQKNTIRQISA